VTGVRTVHRAMTSHRASSCLGACATSSVTSSASKTWIKSVGRYTVLALRPMLRSSAHTLEGDRLAVAGDTMLPDLPWGEGVAPRPASALR
jgi:hypothetical protein